MKVSLNGTYCSTYCLAFELWVDEGRKTLGERAAGEVERLVSEHRPSRLSAAVMADLEGRMTAAAGSCDMDGLHDRDS